MSEHRGRPGFREWVDKQADPNWTMMPLTHLTKGIGAEDICRAAAIKASHCDVFDRPIAYFFYGRPAYRVHGDGAVKLEAACPYCFVFDAKLISEAENIFAFDTGAFEKRLYKHYLMEEMDVDDFNLEQQASRPNKLISTVFGNKTTYFFADTGRIKPPEQLAAAHEFHARSYLHLVSSKGRNEPDDRLCSIEVQLPHDVPLEQKLLAIVAPHTVWDGENHAPWLEKLCQDGVAVAPYIFIPGRHIDYYYAQVELALRELYTKWGAL